jgi:hypothetical protein
VLIELQSAQLETLVLTHDGPVASPIFGPPDWANDSLLHPCPVRTFIAVLAGDSRPRFVFLVLKKHLASDHTAAGVISWESLPSSYLVAAIWYTH